MTGLYILDVFVCFYRDGCLVIFFLVPQTKLQEGYHSSELHGFLYSSLWRNNLR